MNLSVTSHEAEPAARHRGHEARLLADSLRTSRVTLLYGKGSVSRTGLLTNDVLPLLRRRAGDGPNRAARRARAAATLTERRNPGAGRRRRSERVVLFDDWAGEPLAALEVSILSSLPMGVVVQAEHHRLSDLLAELSERLDARFLIVFDAFERLWGPDSRVDAIQEFVDQLSEAANHPGLSANFLLSVDESAASRLEGLRQRIAGFDDSTLWLHSTTQGSTPHDAEEPSVAQEPLSPEAALPVLPLSDSVPPAAPPKRTHRKRPPRQPLPQAPPIGTETVYAFIESTLAKTADASQPWQGTAETAAVTGPMASTAAYGMHEPPGREPRTSPRGATSWDRSTRPTIRTDEPVPSLSEPPSPIDQWLDAAISWCRGVFRPR